MGFLLGVFLIILIIISENGVNKLLGVKKEKISETPGKRIDLWGRGIILIISLCTLPFVINKDISITKWFWIFYFIILFGFQAILEWKFLKHSKQYITSLIFLLLCIIILYNFEYLTQLLDL